MSTAIVRGAGPREGFPDYIIKSLSRNELGIFAGLVERHFKIGTVGQRIDPAWMLPENAPRPWSIPCRDTDATIEDAMCIVSYRYQGGGDTAPREDEVTYRLESTMAEKPIQTHPKFVSQLEALYDFGEHTTATGQTYTGFSQYLTHNFDSTKKGQFLNALSAANGKNETLNPLFGLDTYFSVSVVFVKTYAVPASRMPGHLLNGIGTIVPTPAGVGQFHLPPAARKRNWLKLAPNLSKKGDLVQIEERFALSHVGGFRKPVYDAGQLDEEENLAPGDFVNLMNEAVDEVEELAGLSLEPRAHVAVERDLLLKLDTPSADLRSERGVHAGTATLGTEKPPPHAVDRAIQKSCARFGDDAAFHPFPLHRLSRE